MLIAVLRLRPGFRQLRTLSPLEPLPLSPVPLLDSSDALDIVVAAPLAAPPRGPPVSSDAVSGVVAGPLPVQRGPVLFHFFYIFFRGPSDRLLFARPYYDKKAGAQAVVMRGKFVLGGPNETT